MGAYTRHEQPEGAAERKAHYAGHGGLAGAGLDEGFYLYAMVIRLAWSFPSFAGTGG